MNLEKPLLEQRVVSSFTKVMGPTISRYTKDITVENGVLHLRVTNAALRQQLFEQRFELVSKLNAAVGGEALRDVRLH